MESLNLDSPLYLIGQFFRDRFQSSLWARSVGLLQSFNTSLKETTA